jgi:hypothetical protein
MDNPNVLQKRTWHYLRPPAHFEIAPCSCGNHETQWSEYAGHLWCAMCEKDFVPAHEGVFAGPIPIGAATVLGLSFDRFNMATGCIERFDTDTLEYKQVPAGTHCD